MTTFPFLRLSFTHRCASTIYSSGKVLSIAGGDCGRVNFDQQLVAAGALVLLPEAGATFPAARILSRLQPAS